MSEGKPVCFSGEDPWTAIVHHYGLDIEEEEAFRSFALRQSYDPLRGPMIDQLNVIYQMWEREKRGV